ncbi:MAG: respiratory nitrate reductase subunit gamma [Euryarchaeota archaeon]|nr:respiratory nitrate reductase subunit gamma [Euryarchaeota archaeon]
MAEHMAEYYSGLSVDNILTFQVALVIGFLAVIACAAGILFQMSKWGYGSAGYGKDGQRGSIVAFLKLFLSQTFDKKHEQSVLTTLVMDILLQRRILKRSVLRWVMHITIFWGWIMLFLFSMGIFVVELLSKAGIYHAEVHPLVENFPLIVTLNSVFGYVLLVGVLIAIARRLFITEVREGTTFYDAFLIYGLFVIVITGFISEGIRYNGTEYATTLTNLWSLGISNAASPPAALFHVVISLLFCVALIPFTKYIHIIATPLSILAHGGGE